MPQTPQNERWPLGPEGCLPFNSSDLLHFSAACVVVFESHRIVAPGSSGAHSRQFALVTLTPIHEIDKMNVRGGAAR